MKCGFVAIVGAPNAGKSTLVNRLTGAKVSIVSPKAQTTRFRVLGILMRGDSQVLLVDTPGIFRPRRKLDRAMVNAAWTGAADADLVVLMVDAKAGATDEEVYEVFLRIARGGWALSQHTIKHDEIERYLRIMERVAAQVPLGTGLAFASKYRGKDNVSVTYFGDGAVNQGQVYESFNMAKLWKLPAIYIVENNQYAMGTALARASSNTNLSTRGASFGIPGEQVDGMDVRAVKDAAERAVAWCRAGKGPFILEMMTYRYRGHSMSDPAKYRSREEVEKVRADSDPIEQVRSRILTNKWASEDEIKKIDAKVRDIVNEAAEFATNDPEPDPSELYTDIYADQYSNEYANPYTNSDADKHANEHPNHNADHHTDQHTNSDSNEYANEHTDQHADPHANGNANGYANRDAYEYPDRDAYEYANEYSYRDSNCYANRDAN